MGPLSWIILGALIGGIAFCLFKIKAWAQALATFRNRVIYIHLKKEWGKLKARIKYGNGEIIEDEEIQEITNDELYQLYLDNRITWDQYIALKNEQEILLDKKYP
ncbi:MAG: hypothetical protein U0M28_03235 [Bacteroidales bacterium]|jgi:hypothetical protein|nr:hypothetical protein [Bacteroidales bacterium]